MSLADLKRQENERLRCLQHKGKDFGSIGPPPCCECKNIREIAKWVRDSACPHEWVNCGCSSFDDCSACGGRGGYWKERSA